MSCAAAFLGAGAALLDWTAPFPLVHLADGSYSIGPWDDRVFEAGLGFSALTIVLAAFGRGMRRWLLSALACCCLRYPPLASWEVIGS